MDLNTLILSLYIKDNTYFLNSSDETFNILPVEVYLKQHNIEIPYNSSKLYKLFIAQTDILYKTKYL